MKKLIFNAANILFKKNGKATTLEVKNLLHSENPASSFTLTQSETSHFMKELCKENDWAKILRVTSEGNYFEYFEKKTLPPVGGVVSTSTTTSKVICYISSAPKLYAEGSTRREARRKVHQTFKSIIPGLSYSDINVCSVNYYFNKKIK